MGSHGTFILSADWWTGDPTRGGAFLKSADPQSTAYSATVVPEPDRYFPLTATTLIGILVRCLWLRRHKGAERRFPVVA